MMDRAILTIGSIALVGLLTAGCATYAWRNPNVYSVQQVRSDQYACERDMRQSAYFGSGWAAELNAQQFYNRCMESKGYYRERVN